jgi:hypothetical protein
MMGVPPTIAAVGAVMGGIYWFAKNRARLLNLESGATSEETTAKEKQQNGS